MKQKRHENNITEENMEVDVCKKEIRQKKAYMYLMNCAAPMLTVIFLAGSACWAMEMQYSDKEEFDKNPAAAVFSPNGIDSEPEILKSSQDSQYIETRLPNENMILSVTENTGAELVEACGVYVDNEFIGAVVNGDNIQDELKILLDDFKNDDNVIDAGYAVETELKQGIYRSAALVSADNMKEYLAGEKEIVTEYTADEGDTAEKVADDFGMTVDEVKELNPELDTEEDSLEKGKSLKVREKVSVLPVKYTCEITEEELLDYDVVVDNSGNCFSGEEAVAQTGETRKRINQYEVTYVDGTEVSRKLLKSETVFEPADPEISEESDEQTDNSESEQDLYYESVPETYDQSDTSYEAVSANVSGGFIWPVNGGYVSDPFMSNRNHKGMDIAAPGGTDIYASDGGTVIAAGWNNGGYGNYVIIDHGNGYVTLYGHASAVYVSYGQQVCAGELIAAVGTTGDSTGNHCHFEIMYNGNYLNPAQFIGC